MIILDTDVLSRLRDGSDSALERWLSRLGQRPVISVQSVIEIQFGIAGVRDRDPGFAASLSGWLDQLIASMDVLPLTVAAARLVGEMRAIAGLRALEGDLVIAATAIDAQGPVATLNLRDYRLIGKHFADLALSDPRAPP